VKHPTKNDLVNCIYKRDKSIKEVIKFIDNEIKKNEEDFNECARTIGDKYIY